MQTVLTFIFIFWVIWQSWRGYKQGLWLALLGVSALLAGYVASFLYGQRFAALLSAWDVLGAYAHFIAYPVLFFVVNLLFRHLPVLFCSVMGFSTLSRQQLPFWGLGFGAISGCVSGLLMLWFVSVLTVTLSLSGDNVAMNKADLEREERAPGFALEAVAQSFVSSTTALGLTLTGAEKVQTNVMATAARQPKLMLFSLRDVMQSQALNTVLKSQSTQRMMATNDVGSLVQSPAFQALIQLPAMQTMLAAMPDVASSAADRSTEQFVAEKLTFVWRRMQYLKKDVRVQEILNDPDFIDATRQRNPAVLLMDAKFQRLVALIMDDQVDISEHDFSDMLDALEASNTSALIGRQTNGNSGGDVQAASAKDVLAPKQPYRPQTVYKWVDVDGNTHYSEWDAVPKAQRAKAQPLQR